MKRNSKRTKKMSVVASGSMSLGIVIFALFVMVIVNLLASSNCDQLQKTIGEKEKTLAKLENDRRRASAAWDEMKSSANLDGMLPKHGLAMKLPRTDQVVRMNKMGRPLPGQLSIVRMDKNRKSCMTANYTSRR